MAERKQKPGIPRFYLYGEEKKDVELDSVQVEPIRARSGRHNWIIHPHVHPDHFQILLVTEGGATIDIEDRTLEVTPNSLVVHPAGMVHGIRFRPGTEGRVTTTATSYLNHIAKDDPRLIEAVQEPATYPLEPGGVLAAEVDHAFAAIMREFDGGDPGRRAAIRAHFLTLLVSLLRLRRSRLMDSPGHPDRDFELFSRYRALLEGRFRQQKSLGFYARELGVSTQRLNAACKARSGRTASETMHERIIIEAKRNLLYTEMTVAEIGHSLGYDDPAYFNRFFTQRVGDPPGVYRAKSATTQRVFPDGSTA